MMKMKLRNCICVLFPGLPNEIDGGTNQRKSYSHGSVLVLASQSLTRDEFNTLMVKSRKELQIMDLFFLRVDECM